MFDYHQIIEYISRFVWPILRLTGLFIVVPVFSSALIPNRVKIVLVLSLSLIVSLMIPGNLSLEYFSLKYIVYAIEEIILGVLIGLALQIVFQAFILGGQIIAMQMGLGFATMVDPGSNANVPLMSQFYLFLVMLVFLSLNGHLIVLDAILTSYKTLPIGSLKLDTQSIGSLLMFSNEMFKAAIMVALPAIVSLLLVNLSFGIMTRVSPQLNLFSIGFPITLTLGVMIVFISLYGVLPHIKSTLNHGFNYIEGVIR